MDNTSTPVRAGYVEPVASPDGATQPSPAQRRRRRIAVWSSVAGTTIEWYDYFLYGAVSALIFNKVFFADLDPLTGTIAAFGTFAVGFIIRPFGAAFFGQLGDRRGRKHALMWTLAIMGIATVGIGLLPTSATIGLWAAVLLTLLRMAQGFAAGGEWGGAVLITFENAGGVRRGLMASLPGIGVGLGSVLSTGSVALLRSIMSAEDFLAWGWRVPFIASSCIIIVGVLMRRSLEESEEFQDVKDQPQSEAETAATKAPLVRLIRQYWKELLVVIGTRIGENGSYYLFGTFVVAYAATMQLDTATVLAAVSVAFAISIVTIPFFGWVSDKLGRRLVYAAGALFLSIWAWIFFALLDTNQTIYIFMAIVCGIVLGYSAMFGAQSAFFAEIFPVQVRYSGLALGHAIGAIIGGGLAPLVSAALMKGYGSSTPVSVYACTMGILTLATLFFSRKLRPAC